MHKNLLNASQLAIVGVVTALCCSAPSLAAIIDVNAPPGATFGDLNQHLTQCPEMGCGATAAVNSFVFLQNQYPSVYTNPLVPATNPTLVGETLVANALLGPLFMNTTCSCGTPWESFITGKTNWIEASDPGVTRYRAQSVFHWDTTRFGTEPSGVKDGKVPGINFLTGEIGTGEDVEVLIGSTAIGEHYLTLTGITWDTNTKTGEMRYIDPLDGKAHSGTIRGGNPARGGGIILSYTSPDAIIVDQPVVVEVAVSESPKTIPEPSSGLILIGLLTFTASISIRLPRAECALSPKAPGEGH